MINIVLYEPEIPNNTGNIIRICHATGAKLHIIKPINFFLEPKWLKRSAAGRLLSDIPHEIHENYKNFIKKYEDIKIFYITRYGKINYIKPNYKKIKDIWLMFGKESSGIPKNILQKSLKTCLRIPMIKKERSLNLANSVIILIYEVLRQKKFENLSLFETQKGKNFILE